MSERNRFESPRRRLEMLRSRMNDASDEVSTGLRVRRPSDDPLAAKRLHDLDLRISRLDGHMRSAERVDNRLRETDGVLEEVISLLDEVKSLGLRGANDTNNAEDRALIAEEISSLITQVADLANTRDADGFLFTGALGDVAPVDDALNVKNDDRALSVEVGEGVRVQEGVLAATIFGDGTPATIQVFDTLVALRDAVANGDQGGLDTALADMDTATEQVIDARGTAGIILGRLEGAMTVNDRLQASLPLERASLVEADFVEAVNELSRAESMFQASLAASGRTVGGSTLLDYL
ncbi:MAG: hypothetical protein ACE366_25655 [Bradymonadia bacterium]